MTYRNELPPDLVEEILTEYRANATAPARRAFRARFPNDQERSEYYAELGRRSGQARRARKTASAGNAA